MEGTESLGSDLVRVSDRRNRLRRDEGDHGRLRDEQRDRERDEGICQGS